MPSNHIPTPSLQQLSAALVKRRQAGLPLFWEVGTCSTCRQGHGYSFEAAQPVYVDACSCSHIGSSPASFRQVAESYAVHPNPEQWWQLEPAPVATVAQEAKILHMQHRPQVAIDRVLMDIATEPPLTTIIVNYSGQYGTGVKAKTFPAAGTMPDVLSLLSDVLQWPEASPTVLDWLERQPVQGPEALDLTPPEEADYVARARERLRGMSTELNIVDVPIDYHTLQAKPRGLVQEHERQRPVPISHQQRVVQFGRKHAGAPWQALSISPARPKP